VDDNWFAVGPDGFVTPADAPLGGHAVALALYDDELEYAGTRGWFGFINSWSESWGDRGIGYISYAAFLLSLISCYEVLLHPRRQGKGVREPHFGQDCAPYLAHVAEQCH
jgi:hypothetical protein